MYMNFLRTDDSLHREEALKGFSLMYCPYESDV